MPRVLCEVKDCVSNKDGNCIAEFITIDESITCDNFVERDEDEDDA